MVYSGAWGNLIHEKNQKSKISWHCPFKQTQNWKTLALIPWFGGWMREVDALNNYPFFSSEYVHEYTQVLHIW